MHYKTVLRFGRAGVPSAVPMLYNTASSGAVLGVGRKRAHLSIGMVLA